MPGSPVLWGGPIDLKENKEPKVHPQRKEGPGVRRGTRPTLDRPHWSYSQVSQFLRCPLSYYFDRVVKLPKPFISSALALGATVHQTLADYHWAIQQGRRPSPEQIRAALAQAWDQMEHREPIQYRDGEDRTKLVDLAGALMDLYTQGPTPECIVAVEEPLLVPLFNSRGQALEKPLLAIPDLITRQEGELNVTEFKTSGRRFGDLETENSLQASCYAHAVQERYGEQPRVRYTVLVKTKKPQIQHLEAVRDDADFTRLGDIVEVVQRAIEAEAYYPIESPMNCSGCPFFKPCKEWKGCPTRRAFSDEANARHEELARC